MAFKMRSNPFQRNFGSALKHYPEGVGLHSHEDKQGDQTFHERSPVTGQTKTYKKKKDDRGNEVLVVNPISGFGKNKFDE